MMEKLLRCEEVAQILNISKPYAYRLMADGTIPSLRLGKTIRVRYADLEIFIQGNISSTPGFVNEINGNKTNPGHE
jgi:excisionase family DNA binding protein